MCIPSAGWRPPDPESGGYEEERVLEGFGGRGGERGGLEKVKGNPVRKERQYHTVGVKYDYRIK